MNDPSAPPKRERRWGAVPAARSSAPVLKIRLTLVLGFLIASAVLGLFGGIAWIVSRPEPPEPPPPTPEATGFATEVASAWLDGRTLNLPAAEGVDATFGAEQDERVALSGTGALAWDGFRLLTPTPGRNLEVHRFIVGGNPPRQLVVTVELTDAGPVLAAAPAFEPLAVAAETTPRFDYLNGPDAQQLTDDVTNVAEDWAEAFAADNRERLRELTGDPQPRTYPGLGGGFSAGTTSVLSATAAGEDRWVVRVFTVLTGPDEFTGTGEWDLLIENPETANPRVVAWGPAGLGLYLEPYENGLAGGGESTSTTTTTVAGEGGTEDRPTPPDEPAG